MLNKSPSLQWYPDKWLADTRRLPWAVKGIYKDLLDVIWLQFQESCSIPDQADFIAAELGCGLDEWETARNFIMLPHRPLMELKSNCLFSKGLWKEREKQRIRRERLAENGKKGGRPRKEEKQKVIFEKPIDKAGSGNLNKRLPSPSPSPSPTPLRTGRKPETGVLGNLEGEKGGEWADASNPVKLALSITGEAKLSPGDMFYEKARLTLGNDLFRDVVLMFQSEINAGEDVRNRGAALTAKLKRFMAGRAKHE